ncbi:MAG: cell division protein, partial [Bdellovibrionia bacterium]
IPSDRLKALKSRQFESVVTLPPRRGAILDREGRDLAMSATVYSLYADPKVIENKKQTARQVAKIIGQSHTSVFQKIKDGKKRFVWLERMLDQERAEKIRNLKIRGLALVEEWKRVYPNESLLSQTMGFTGLEGQGLEGIENKYDSYLKGNTKKVTVRRDARGRPLIYDGLMFTETPDGDDLQLTIDTELQYALEGELKSAVEGFEAESAVGI